MRVDWCDVPGGSVALRGGVGGGGTRSASVSQDRRSDGRQAKPDLTLRAIVADMLGCIGLRPTVPPAQRHR